MAGVALGVTLGIDLIPGTGSGGGGGGGGGGGTPPALDLISVQATNAYSCYRKLRAAHAGAAFRVRRSSDDTELSVGFAGNFLDRAALLAFVGSGSGFIATLYDQSGNGRDLIQTTLAAQPRIVNAGALDKYPSGTTAMFFDGTDDRVARSVPGNTTGLTGNPNITMASVFQVTNPATGYVPCVFGNVAAAAGTVCGLTRGTGGNASIQATHAGSGRNFQTVAAVNTAGQSYVLQRAAGGTTHADSMRQGGTPLTPGTTNGTAVSLNLSDSALNLGNYVTNTGQTQGRLNVFMLFNAVLAGADLAALETELATHA